MHLYIPWWFRTSKFIFPSPKVLNSTLSGMGFCTGVIRRLPCTHLPPPPRRVFGFLHYLWVTAHSPYRGARSGFQQQLQDGGVLSTHSPGAAAAAARTATWSKTTRFSPPLPRHPTGSARMIPGRSCTIFNGLPTFARIQLISVHRSCGDALRCDERRTAVAERRAYQSSGAASTARSK